MEYLNYNKKYFSIFFNKYMIKISNSKSIKNTNLEINNIRKNIKVLYKLNGINDHNSFVNVLYNPNT
jgi:hypothetical protein